MLYVCPNARDLHVLIHPQILYGVSKYSDRHELSLPTLRGGLGFLDRAKTLLGQDLHEPSVPTIQALLLLANSLGAQGIAGNGSMLYLKIGEPRSQHTRDPS